jgi:hypothetical protein
LSLARVFERLFALLAPFFARFALIFPAFLGFLATLFEPLAIILPAVFPVGPGTDRRYAKSEGEKDD